MNPVSSATLLLLTLDATPARQCYSPAQGTHKHWELGS